MESVNISVIIPIYNGKKFLEKCVRSLFEQTITTNIEFIFVNDCTQDESIVLLEKLMKAYSERKLLSKIIHHKQNEGVAAARNTGINNALGKYLFFIDQDDYLDKDALWIFYSEAEKENADIVYSNYLYQYRYHSHIRKNKKIVDKQNYLIELFESNISIELWPRLYKKELFDSHNLHFFENTSGADDLAIVPILFYYAIRIKYIDFAPYHYVRYNWKAVTQQKMGQSRVEAIVCAINHLENFFKKKETIYLQALKRTKFHMRIYCITYTRGELQRASCSLFPEIETEPATIKEKLICFLSEKKALTLLNFIFNTKKVYIRLMEYMFFCRKQR